MRRYQLAAVFGTALAFIILPIAFICGMFVLQNAQTWHVGANQTVTWTLTWPPRALIDSVHTTLFDTSDPCFCRINWDCPIDNNQTLLDDCTLQRRTIRIKEFPLVDAERSEEEDKIVFRLSCPLVATVNPTQQGDCRFDAHCDIRWGMYIMIFLVSYSIFFLLLAGSWIFCRRRHGWWQEEPTCCDDSADTQQKQYSSHVQFAYT